MTMSRKPLSRLGKLGFRIPVWLYQARLGFIFRGRVIVIVHRGRRSNKRYLSGLEALVRSRSELPIFSGWGTRADWYRNIEANGVDELWDGRTKYRNVPFRVVDAQEAFDILTEYEQVHRGAAKALLPRIQADYDFSDDARRQLSEAAVIVAFAPSAGV